MSVFLVEDGSGVTLATSYVTLVEAGLYLSDLPPSLVVNWLALTLPQQEALLMYASSVLDARSTYNGQKIYQTSGLRWPRTGATDCDNFPVGNNVIPKGLKQAVYELALFYATPGRGLNVIDDAQGLSRLQVDVLVFEWQKNYNQSIALQLPPGINSYLCGLGKINYSGKSRSVPIIRA